MAARSLRKVVLAISASAGKSGWCWNLWTLILMEQSWTQISNLVSNLDTHTHAHLTKEFSTNWSVFEARQCVNSNARPYLSSAAPLGHFSPTGWNTSPFCAPSWRCPLFPQFGVEHAITVVPSDGVFTRRHTSKCAFCILQCFLLLYNAALGGEGGAGTTDVTDGTWGDMLTFHVTCSRCWCYATLGWGGMLTFHVTCSRCWCYATLGGGGC